VVARIDSGWVQPVTGVGYAVLDQGKMKVKKPSDAEAGN